MNFLLSICLAFGASFLTCQNTPDPGRYVGYLSLPAQSSYLRLDYQADTSTLRIPELIPARDFILTWDDTGFHFTHQHALWKATDIKMDQDELSGLINYAGQEGQFQLFRVSEESDLDTGPYTNIYQLPNGTFINLWDQRGSLRMHAPISGKVSSLTPIGDHRFVSNGGELISFSDASERGFRQMSYQYFDSKPIQASYAPDIRIERHEVEILGDMVGLSLYLPVGEGMFPACIIPMGAARYERWIYALEARILATHGIATLIYDNYGVGKSNGTFPDKTFADKKDQLLALHKWLATHPQIVGNKIGFRGGSQGGRLSFMAAAEEPQTAFVVALSAPLETRMDQQLYALPQYHRAAGYAEDIIVRNAEVWRRYFDAVIQEKIDQAIVAEVQALRADYPEMYLPGASADVIPRLPWAADLTDSGKDYLKDVNCPILALYGALDDVVPAQKSAAILRAELQAAGKAPASIIIYEGANHSFSLTGQRIVPDLFMDQIWFIKSALAARSD